MKMVVGLSSPRGGAMDFFSSRFISFFLGASFCFLLVFSHSFSFRFLVCLCCVLTPFCFLSRSTKLSRNNCPRRVATSILISGRLFILTWPLVSPHLCSCSCSSRALQFETTVATEGGGLAFHLREQGELFLGVAQREVAEHVRRAVADGPNPQTQEHGGVQPEAVPEEEARGP